MAFKVLKYSINFPKVDFSDYFISSYAFQFSVCVLSLHSQEYNYFHET